jgi:7-keto-8-aminopelargonate synthetase-like enzyme
VPISGVVTVGVFGDFTEDFIVTCGVYSNSADIAVVMTVLATKPKVQ